MRESATPEADRLPEFLTTREVATALKVAPSTVCRWRAAGLGPRVFWVAPASPRYKRADVLAWLDRIAA